MSICSHQGIDLILDGLNAGAQLVLKTQLHDFLLCPLIQGTAELLLQLETELLPALAQIFPKVLNVHGLAAVLIAGHGRDDLGGDGTGHLEALGGFYHFSVDRGAVVQHVLNIYQAAVENRLDKIIRVMEMKHAIVMGQGDMLRQQHTPGHVPGDLTGDVIPLGGSQTCVLVGILLRQFLVLIADEF